MAALLLGFSKKILIHFFPFVLHVTTLKYSKNNWILSLLKAKSSRNLPASCSCDSFDLNNNGNVGTQENFANV